MRPEDDPGWASYAETHLVIHGPVPVRIDLAHPLGPREGAGLVASGLPGTFGLVTPENPFGHPSDAAQNAERLARFLAELGPRPHVRVDGVSPDGAHVEHGVALAWPCAEVVALAERWEQSAIYWFDGQAFWVVGALTVAAPWRLGSDR
jgi:hypothetical protein